MIINIVICSSTDSIFTLTSIGEASTFDSSQLPQEDASLSHASTRLVTTTHSYDDRFSYTTQETSTDDGTEGNLYIILSPLLNYL